jgi:hypothetical protein
MPQEEDRDRRLLREEGREGRAREGGHEAAPDGDDAGRAWCSVDRRELAHMAARLDDGVGDLAARGRDVHDPHGSLDDEQHLAARLVAGEDGGAGRVAPPGAAAGEPLSDLGCQRPEEPDAIEGARLAHAA